MPQSPFDPSTAAPTTRRQVVMLSAATLITSGTLAACGDDGTPSVAVDPAADSPAGNGEASPTRPSDSAPDSSGAAPTAEQASPRTSARATSKDDDTTTSRTTSTKSTTPKRSTTSKKSTTPTKPSTEDFSKGALVQLSDVPVGGSVVIGETVVTRTGSASVVGHSSVCTHAGCKVEAAGRSLTCPCHGSRFDAASGAVQNGPASSGLPGVRLVVKGGYVHRA